MAVSVSSCKVAMRSWHNSRKVGTLRKDLHMGDTAASSLMRRRKPGAAERQKRAGPRRTGAAGLCGQRANSAGAVRRLPQREDAERERAAHEPGEPSGARRHGAVRPEPLVFEAQCQRDALLVGVDVVRCSAPTHTHTHTHTHARGTLLVSPKTIRQGAPMLLEKHPAALSFSLSLSLSLSFSLSLSLSHSLSLSLSLSLSVLERRHRPIAHERREPLELQQRLSRKWPVVHLPQNGTVGFDPQPSGLKRSWESSVRLQPQAPLMCW